RHNHLIARPDAQAGESRRQRRGAAGGHVHVLDAQELRVALLEPRALRMFRIAEQLLRPDRLCDRLNFLSPHAKHASLRYNVPPAPPYPATHLGSDSNRTRTPTPRSPSSA